MPLGRGDRLRHILVERNASAEPYTYPRDVRGPKLDLPARERSQHGHGLLEKLEALRQDLVDVNAARRAVGISDDRGLCVEFESEPGFELALQSLDRTREKIELLAVRQRDGVHLATVHVGHGKLDNLVRLVTKYIEEDDARWGKPKNRKLVESISSIRKAALASFWTDDQELFPQENEAIWWEVWLRIEAASREAVVGEFRSRCDELGLRPNSEILNFAERSVLLVHGTGEQMSSSVTLLDSIAELRRAKDPPSFYARMTSEEQRPWVEDLRNRMRLPEGDAASVCILDTGVNSGHPLLDRSLANESLLTYNNDWGAADHDGHGTEMAGLSLLGDLTEQLSGASEVPVEHCLESVKLLPPPAFSPNEPDLYGAITSECVARAEVAAPHRNRAICMAVTTDYRDRGKPSSWSSEVDQICVGADGGQQRLMFLSAGNVEEHEWRFYPDYNDVAQVQDPGQAWNAVTVGAYTRKAAVDDQRRLDWPVIAEAGTLSPSSSTSVSWQSQWPNKPDVVLEGGNAARDPANGDAAPLDDLVLLTTNWKPQERLVVPTWATSAATAQASRIAAILMARYPSLWPETIRGLMVHSADWTAQMLKQVEGYSDATGKNALLRRYGYGVPDLDLACWSAQNVLTLVAQDELQPYYKSSGSSAIKTKDMNVHQLPWPTQELRDLGNVPVELRVTLSYFIEPNPAERGWTRKHRYQSCGLRFQMKKPLESLDDFRARVSKEAQDEDAGIPFPGDSEWYIGEGRRNRGSLHSDRWRGPALELAARSCLAVHPVTGWWRERAHLDRWDGRVRYALVVTIQAPEVDVDIYTPVANMVTAPVPVPVPTG